MARVKEAERGALNAHNGTGMDVDDTNDVIAARRTIMSQVE